VPVKVGKSKFESKSNLMTRELEIWINEKKHLFPPTNESLISLLRRIGYTGTKLGCSEGGCGSCTVLVSYFCYSTKTIK